METGESPGGDSPVSTNPSEIITKYLLFGIAKFEIEL